MRAARALVIALIVTAFVTPVVAIVFGDEWSFVVVLPLATLGAWRVAR